MKIAKTFALIFAFVFTSIAYAGDKPFEGVIIYDLAFEGLPPEAQKMFEGSTMKTYVKDKKVRTEMDMGVSQTTTITDEKSKQTVVLMDMMGQKMMTKVNADSAKNPVKDIKYVDEIIEIAGYKCKKAEVTMVDNTAESAATSVIYYTEDIHLTPYASSFKTLKGFPMQYEMNQQGMTIKIKVKSVNKETVPDNKFDIPEGYKEFDMNMFSNPK